MAILFNIIKSFLFFFLIQIGLHAQPIFQNNTTPYNFLGQDTLFDYSHNFNLPGNAIQTDNPYTAFRLQENGHEVIFTDRYHPPSTFEDLLNNQDFPSLTKSSPNFNIFEENSDLQRSSPWMTDHSVGNFDEENNKFKESLGETPFDITENFKQNDADHNNYNNPMNIQSTESRFKDFPSLTEVSSPWMTDQSYGNYDEELKKFKESVGETPPDIMEILRQFDARHNNYNKTTTLQSTTSKSKDIDELIFEPTIEPDYDQSSKEDNIHQTTTLQGSSNMINKKRKNKNGKNEKEQSDKNYLNEPDSSQRKSKKLEFAALRDFRRSVEKNSPTTSQVQLTSVPKKSSGELHKQFTWSTFKPKLPQKTFTDLWSNYSNSLGKKLFGPEQYWTSKNAKKSPIIPLEYAEESKSNIDWNDLRDISNNPINKPYESDEDLRNRIVDYSYNIIDNNPKLSQEERLTIFNLVKTIPKYCKSEHGDAIFDMLRHKIDIKYSTTSNMRIRRLETIIPRSYNSKDRFHTEGNEYLTTQKSKTDILLATWPFSHIPLRYFKTRNQITKGVRRISETRLEVMRFLRVCDAPLPIIYKPVKRIQNSFMLKMRPIQPDNNFLFVPPPATTELLFAFKKLQEASITELREFYKIFQWATLSGINDENKVAAETFRYVRQISNNLNTIEVPTDLTGNELNSYSGRMRLVLFLFRRYFKRTMLKLGNRNPHNQRSIDYYYS
ncbi:hypothetical protein SNEBB_002974 [Seison nebaliae]|nr:hypothetical protein SNEBB_002974 [Seison nebaliae]